MTVTLSVPGQPPLELNRLLLDLNGTLTNRGELLDGVAARIGQLRDTLDIHLLSADTFGSLDGVATQLGGVRTERVRTGTEKARHAASLGAHTCAAIGNGANDEDMLAAVALGIAVIGAEGASPRALSAADIVCTSITDALDLLADPSALTATLRG